jgi:hypothetical protein
MLFTAEYICHDTPDMGAVMQQPDMDSNVSYATVSFRTRETRRINPLLRNISTATDAVGCCVVATTMSE